MIRLGLLFVALVSAGCAGASIRVTSMRVLVSDDDNSKYPAGAPFDVRPGGQEVVYLSGGQLVSVNEEGRLERLLLEEESSLIDLAFRSENVLLVLEQSGVALFFGGRLVPGWEIALSDDAQMATGPGEVWIADNRDILGRLESSFGRLTWNDGTVAHYGEKRGRLLRLDPELDEFRVIAEFDHPIRAVEAAPGGCYIAIDETVYRLLLSKQGGTAEMLFVLAAPPGSTVVSIAADLENKILYAASETETFAYAGGKAVPFYPLGGRIRSRGGTLYLSSPVAGLLAKFDGAHHRAHDLVGN